LSPETPIPDTPTDCHLSQLDRMTQICLELLALSFVLNPRQLGSPEIPMHVDPFCRWISAADIKTSPARLTCDRKRDSPTLRWGASRVTCRPGYFLSPRQIMSLTLWKHFHGFCRRFTNNQEGAWLSICGS
jgi:hypothetical protein